MGELENHWIPADKKPVKEGAYLCDIGQEDAVVFRFVDGHWYFHSHGYSIKDHWVNYWMECPKQLRDRPKN